MSTRPYETTKASREDARDLGRVQGTVCIAARDFRNAAELGGGLSRIAMDARAVLFAAIDRWEAEAKRQRAQDDALTGSAGKKRADRRAGP